jgi:hypothetical protein
MLVTVRSDRTALSYRLNPKNLGAYWQITQ